MKKITTKTITITAMLMAMNIAMCSFSVPVPGGHLYFCDAVICLAAMLLNPFCAFVVGGIGAFLGDLIFYPVPMFVSLVSHGLQAVIISVCTRYYRKAGKEVLGAIIGVILGGIVMVIGYTLGRAFIYSTKEYAILKLPYEILQAAVGAVLGTWICYGLKVKKLLIKLQLLSEDE